MGSAAKGVSGVSSALPWAEGLWANRMLRMSVIPDRRFAQPGIFSVRLSLTTGLVQAYHGICASMGDMPINGDTLRVSVTSGIVTFGSLESNNGSVFPN